MKPYTAIVIGAGSRGNAYAANMKKWPDKFQIVGVAEPIKARREKMRDMFSLSDDACYPGYQEILQQPKMADIAIIATMDALHTEPALKAIELGYHLLLEKPVAPTPEECVAIAKAAEEKGVSVLVCHVLRYTPFYKTVKRLIMDGVLGDIQSVMAVEGVGNIHQSHSYVRGDWHREDETNPMLLAKCCHDLDIIQWLLDRPCKKVSSFGKLSYFTPENAPEGAPKRCFGSECPARESCPYSCDKVYLSEKSAVWMQRHAARGFTKEHNPTLPEIEEGLKNTNFGACVFHADNTVVDHQVVNMEFAGGVTASLTMNAFNEGGRYIRVFGTKGELYANARDTEITVYSFESGEKTVYSTVKTDESITGGHGSGDGGIVRELYEYLGGDYTGFTAADIDISVRNHLIGFAAEKARHEDTVENLDDYFARYGLKNDR
ncbi:MAG: Gfo/Idh/MocA family oxidoreductase [Clostridia bacterium]|nr:Gfo/Idh/MocA family oxidoreductase [Clostridia bacterium]